MAEQTAPSSLKSRVIKTESVDWSSFKYIQHNEFKELTVEAKSRLRNSILANEFTQPFYVWQEPGTTDIYCLDGKHRCTVLQELIADGYSVPSRLPATFIVCADKKEAARLVLVYSSMYAKITQQRLVDFIQLQDIEYESILETIKIPDLDLSKLMGEFDKDFGILNKELDLDDFDGTVVWKLRFDREEYLALKEAVDWIILKGKYTTPESVISSLIHLKKAEISDE